MTEDKAKMQNAMTFGLKKQLLSGGGTTKSGNNTNS